MSYPPPNQQGGMYPTPYNSGYPPAPPPGYQTPNAPGYPPNQGYGPPPQQGYQPPPGQYPPGAGYGPITNQPLGPPGGWMNMPQSIPNCPPGLEYLTMIDQLLVQQKVEILEALTGFETQNKFTVKNSLGQKVYYAVEDSDCLTRNCCGPLRPFDMKILDNYRNEVIHLHRPLACDSCCFPCCLQSMEVSSPPGTVVGTVEQEWSIFCPSFAIKNSSGDTVLRIEGPLCTWSICGDVEFKIMSGDGAVQVGKISKQWSGLLREMFTDTDYFGITFPMDLDVRMKAVMLGACFLIDAMFFENTQKDNSAVI
ncbi:phospholipid scramblase 2 isoform X1 [Diorhabda sublineata]|uniref:phospholipid scramblase 2 isoform X1 n=1 Tax=Diorhabda sublineata TaxID=1163346 RepID=UPI0024E06B03|nr:phospholipid scramblase 2 isoform X1 [Diorhabda sublineata]